MDKYRLFYEMKVAGITREEMCMALNMSQSTFSRKCNGKSEFTLSEMNIILSKLNKSDPKDIFFTDKVS